MSDTQIPLPSLADRVRAVNAGAPVVGVHFFRSTPVFVLGVATGVAIWAFNKPLKKVLGQHA